VPKRAVKAAKSVKAAKATSAPLKGLASLAVLLEGASKPPVAKQALKATVEAPVTPLMAVEEPSVAAAHDDDEEALMALLYLY
jgi:hypothetical protein